MLLELFRHWSESVSGFSVFNYLTLRALLAALTALFIGFAAGPAVIRKLRAMHFGQAVRTDGPKSHLVKDGTPTMGGALMLAGIGVSTLLWADLSNRFVWVTLFVTMGYGLVGWIDDYRKVVHHNPKGMSAREKFGWQSLIALVAGVYLVFALAVTPGATMAEAWQTWLAAGMPLEVSENLHLLIPFFKDIALPFGLFGFLIFTFIVIVGSSNAVNLTDGLDGLAILPSVLVGALALGGCLGTVAVITRQEIVLAIMGGIFVVETLSVMIQTVYFRLSHGKRVFLMAPIHHHFELKGWKETQVVTRFWIITFILVLIGLSTLKIR